MKRTTYPTFTREEFIERIRRICGIPDEITGAPHADPCCVRKPTDKGYFPTSQPKKETQTQ